MPELLDLPAELVEHIFSLCEDLIYQELEDAGQEEVTIAPLLRMANRYIEKCTRRVFAASYFHTQGIKMTEHASIKRFCDISRYPELAKRVDELKFYTVKDQHGSRHVFPVDRNEFVDALRECPAVEEFVFYDAPCDQAADRTEGNLDVPPPHKVVDLSSSFSFVLSAAEAAGLHSKRIRTSTCKRGEMPQCGLADCSAILEKKSVLLEVEEFDIHIVPKPLEHGVTPQEMGLRLGRQLAAGFINMPALKVLELWFYVDSAGGIPAWIMLADVPKLSCLNELVLHGCNMNIDDMTSFVLKHIETLELLDLSRLRLHEGTPTDIGLFYAKLSNAPRLDDFYQYELALVTFNGNLPRVEAIQLPRHLCLPETNGYENEDGYTVIGPWRGALHWKGHQEVKDVMSSLASCLF